MQPASVRAPGVGNRSSNGLRAVVEVLAVVCLWLTAFPLPAAAQDEDEPVTLSAIREAREDDLGREELTEVLVALGPTVMQELLLCFEPSWLDDWKLSRGERAAVRACLEQHRPKLVIRAIDTLAQARPSLRASREYLRIIGHLGQWQELSVCVALMGDSPETMNSNNPLFKEFTSSIRRVLARGDVDEYGLARLVRETPAVLIPQIVDALDVLEPDCRCLVLAELLGARQWLPEVLEAAGQTLRQTRRSEATEPLAVELLSVLKDDVFVLENWSIAKLTIESLAHTQRASLIPDLLEFCAHWIDDIPKVERLVCQTVERLAKRRMRRTLESWEDWLEAERNWYHQQGQRQIEDLSETGSRDFAITLRGLMLHSMYADEIGPQLMDLVDSTNPMKQRLACLALAQIAHYEAVPRLVDVLFQEDDESVVATAHQSLKRLTRRDYAPDSDRWIEEFANR